MTEAVLEVPEGDNGMSDKLVIPFWKRYVMSVEEASLYFRIGQTKLRAMIDQEPTAEYILWNGNRALIKRKRFEEFIDNAVSV